MECACGMAIPLFHLRWLDDQPGWEAMNPHRRPFAVRRADAATLPLAFLYPLERPRVLNNVGVQSQQQAAGQLPWVNPQQATRHPHPTELIQRALMQKDSRDRRTLSRRQCIKRCQRRE